MRRLRYGCAAVLALSRGCALLGHAVPPARDLPKFQIKLLDGTALKSKDFQDRVAVIDFWGTWCKPCLAEIPDYNSFYADYRDRGIVFVAVAVESGSESQVRDAVKRLGMQYPVSAHPGRQPDPFADITVFPTTWVVRNGRIEKEFIGTPPGKHRDLRDWVDRLLALR